MGTARKNSLIRTVEGSVTNEVLELTTVPVVVVAGDAASKAERYGFRPASARAWHGWWSLLRTDKDKSMKCPTCPDATLAITDRQGIEIDHCPQCRGVWLDRGELDKLIERAAMPTPGPVAASSRPDFVDSDFHDARRHPARRRKSWLSDIFD